MVSLIRDIYENYLTNREASYVQSTQEAPANARKKWNEEHLSGVSPHILFSSTVATCRLAWS